MYVNYYKKKTPSNRRFYLTEWGEENSKEQTRTFRLFNYMGCFLQEAQKNTDPERMAADYLEGTSLVPSNAFLFLHLQFEFADMETDRPCP